MQVFLPLGVGSSRCKFRKENAGVNSIHARLCFEIYSFENYFVAEPLNNKLTGNA